MGFRDSMPPIEATSLSSKPGVRDLFHLCFRVSNEALRYNLNCFSKFQQDTLSIYILGRSGSGQRS